MSKTTSCIRSISNVASKIHDGEFWLQEYTSRHLIFHKPLLCLELSEQLISLYGFIQKHIDHSKVIDNYGNGPYLENKDYVCRAIFEYILKYIANVDQYRFEDKFYVMNCFLSSQEVSKILHNFVQLSLEYKYYIHLLLNPTNPYIIIDSINSDNMMLIDSLSVPKIVYKDDININVRSNLIKNNHSNSCTLNFDIILDENFNFKNTIDDIKFYIAQQHQLQTIFNHNIQLSDEEQEILDTHDLIHQKFPREKQNLERALGLLAFDLCISTEDAIYENWLKSRERNNFPLKYMPSNAIIYLDKPRNDIFRKIIESGFYTKLKKCNFNLQCIQDNLCFYEETCKQFISRKLDNTIECIAKKSVLKMSK